MPCDFLLDTSLLDPFPKIQVADVVMRQLEYTFFKVIIIRLANKTDKSVIQRNDYPAPTAVVFRLLLLETERPCGIIHIAIGQLACVAPTYPGI